jgi:hypothetical protein
MTPDYYIHSVTTPFWLAPVVGYYTFKPIPILNPIVVDFELEHNQFLT